MKNKNNQLRVVNPTTSGSRGMTFVFRKELHKKGPVKSLVRKHKRSLGRDDSGTISTRHKGGGHKRKYRIISTLDQCGLGPFNFLRKEYDPNRSAYIALIENSEGKKFYILAPLDTTEVTSLQMGEEASINIGNRKKIGEIPTGIAIHSIEIYPNSRAKMVRAAGTKAVVMTHEGGYALVKLPSGEVRKFHENCLASIGVLSNSMHNMVKYGKAGRKRHMGIRPTVRGKAMHPAAHPHGGGEGVNPIGLKHPKTPWGKPAMGYKTKRHISKFIVKPRPRRK